MYKSLANYIHQVVSSIHLNVHTTHQWSLARIYFDFSKFQDIRHGFDQDALSCSVQRLFLTLVDHTRHLKCVSLCFNHQWGPFQGILLTFHGSKGHGSHLDRQISVNLMLLLQNH